MFAWNIYVWLVAWSFVEIWVRETSWTNLESIFGILDLSGVWSRKMNQQLLPEHLFQNLKLQNQTSVEKSCLRSRKNKSSIFVFTAKSKTLRLWNVRTLMRKSSEIPSTMFKISFETSLEIFMCVVLTRIPVQKPMWIKLESFFWKLLIIRNLRHGRKTFNFNLKFPLKNWSSRLKFLWNKSCRCLKIVISQLWNRFFFLCRFSVFSAREVDEKNSLQKVPFCFTVRWMKSTP